VSGPFCSAAPSGDLTAIKPSTTFGGRTGTVTKAEDPATTTTFGGRTSAPSRLDLTAAYQSLNPSTREALLGLSHRVRTPPPVAATLALPPAADTPPAPRTLRTTVDAVVRHPATPWIAGALALGAVGAVAYRLARR
jgi:hypothetical protein